MTDRTLPLLTIEYHTNDLLIPSTVLSNFLTLCLSHLFSVWSRSILLCSLATCFSVLSCCFALAQPSYLAPSPCFIYFVVSHPSAIRPILNGFFLTQSYARTYQSTKPTTTCCQFLNYQHSYICWRGQWSSRPACFSPTSATRWGHPHNDCWLCHDHSSDASASSTSRNSTNHHQ